MNQERIAKVLLAPIVTEKSAMAQADRHYAFKVTTDATKPEIAAAVAKFFEVEVEAVRTLNVKGKAKRFGNRMGKRNDWKKAVVRLKDGDAIDFGGA